MQVLVKTYYNNEEKIMHVYEDVRRINECFDYVELWYVDKMYKTTEIKLDGYTELVVR